MTGTLSEGYLIMTKQKSELQPVLVTTAHRGVFFGYLDGPITDAPNIRIERARMAVYWNEDVRGVLGLASNGPNKNCRIGPTVLAITLRDVTSVTEVTDTAVEAWEQGPWR